MNIAFIRVLIVLVVSGFCSMATAQKNCELKIPPPQSGINATHGFFLFVFPRALGLSYSGCQTVWDEKGDKRFVLKFAQGSLTEYEENESSNALTRLTCKYDGGSLIQDSSKNCPDYEDIKSGFRTVPDDYELIVPSNKDPRRR